MARRSTLSLLLIVGLVLLGWYGSRKYRHDAHAEEARAEVAGLVKDEVLRDGDIIFQSSRSGQSRAIELATGSPYSHCGMIFRSDTGRVEWYVLEAVQPVKWTALDDWIARGVNGHYVIKRLDASLDGVQAQALKAVGGKYVGKDYDLQFGWDDERIYCSELVWKAYDQALGIRLGEPQNLSDLDLNDPAVRAKLQERYGERLPTDEPMVSPVRIFDSPQLKVIRSGGISPL